jgi:hypothetical protein
MSHWFLATRWIKVVDLKNIFTTTAVYDNVHYWLYVRMHHRYVRSRWQLHLFMHAIGPKKAKKVVEYLADIHFIIKCLFLAKNNHLTYTLTVSIINEQHCQSIRSMYMYTQKMFLLRQRKKTPHWANLLEACMSVAFQF